MTTHTLDILAFRAAFPAFTDGVKYPDVMLLAYYQAAGAYISLEDAYGGLSGAVLDFALQLLLAHLVYGFSMIARGKTNLPVTAATIDKVAVSLMPPPAKTGWEFWLSTSPYGLQLWALLDVKSTGGWSIGGLPETGAFRKVGGFF